MNQPPPKLTTTFLAIEIPEEIRDRLEKIQKKLNKVNHQVAWELPEKLHVTFVYFGKISEIDTNTMVTVLQNLASKTQPISSSVGYLGYFFKRHGDGIVWIAVNTKGILEDFYKQIVKPLNQLGFSLSDKKLIAHITLGRLKKVKGKQQMKILDKLACAEIPGIDNIGNFMIDKVTVFSSHFVKEMNTTEFKVVKEVCFS